MKQILNNYDKKIKGKINYIKFKVPNKFGNIILADSMSLKISISKKQMGTKACIVVEDMVANVIVARVVVVMDKKINPRIKF